MNILHQFVHIICPKVMFSTCRRVTTCRFFDDVRDAFHASIVFVKATRHSYHTWCNENNVSTNVRHHASDIVIIMYQHTDGHDRDHTSPTLRTHIQTDMTETVDLEPHIRTHAHTDTCMLWNWQFIKHIVTEMNTIEAWKTLLIRRQKETRRDGNGRDRGTKKRRLYAVIKSRILHQVEKAVITLWLAFQGHSVIAPNSICMREVTMTTM